MRRHLTLAVTSCLGLLMLLSTPAMATPPPIYEWGMPVASGGPGPTPTADQNLGQVQIDAGNTADVAVLSDGSVWAWGGEPLTTASMIATKVSGVQDVVQRPVDANHSFDFLEQPGLDSSCPTSTTVIKWSPTKGVGVVTKLNCQDVVQLAAGASHTLALTSDGRVYVWGGGSAELGLGSGVKSESKPTLNPTATALTGGTATGVEITAGSSTSGLLVRGRAYCWGLNAQDQCGIGTTSAAVYTPTMVDQGSLSFTWIDQGGNYSTNGHTLAIASDGTVWAWGDGSSGQLGQGTTVSHAVPVIVSFPAGVAIADVRAGGAFSLALDTAGNVWAWGGNANNEIGNGSATKVLTPVDVLGGMTQISAGARHSLASS